MNQEELNIIENKIMQVRYELSYVTTLGRILHQVYHCVEYETPADIDGLMYILNFYIKVTNKKLQKLENHIMRCKRS